MGEGMMKMDKGRRLAGTTKKGKEMKMDEGRR
jgi:hypothetical protein